MDLIDRYLEGIRWLLPSAERDDILAELRDVLMTRREEKQAALGRSLTRAEDEALLLDFGSPLAVASRYGRQRYMIGPDVYPVYELVLKIVLAVIAVSAAITLLSVTASTQGDAGQGIVKGLDVAWNGAFASIGVVTVVFAVLERSGAFKQMTDRWGVRDLPRRPRAPRVHQPNWIDWVSGIVFHLLFILWWLGLIHFWPSDIATEKGARLHFAFAPELSVLYWPVLAVSASVIGVNFMKLASRESRPIGAGLDFLVRTAVIVMAAFALHVGHWVAVTGVGIAPIELAKTQLGVNIGARVTLIGIIFGMALSMAIEGWRMFRAQKSARAATNA
ncbi:MAG TPA: hypothetical protein VN694_06415 [Caulobacteraceae bacterium]|nr:hypothetical protein [Caulobacteraceae bacterium]